MIVDFDTLNNESRVWVYQSNRTISIEEIIEIELKIKDFIDKNFYNYGSTVKNFNDLINKDL